MMPLGAYVEGYRRISLVLARSLPERTLSSQALANGEGRGTDILVENCRFMRRDVDRAASLRTDPSIYALYGIISAQRRQSGNASAHRVHIKGCSFGRSPVTIDAAVRRSEGSGAPHRISAKGFRYQILRFAQNDREGVLYQILRFAQNDRTMFRTTVCQGSEYSVPVLRRTVRTD